MTSSSPMETTGRYLVLLPEDVNSGIGAVTNSTGIRSFARAADFAGHVFASDQLESAEASVFDDLGVAVVSLDPDQAQAVRVATSTDAAILAVEPERVVYAIADLSTGLSTEYLKGYRDSINQLIEQADGLHGKVEAAARFTDGSATWGLQATKVVDTHYSGLGVKVAVLDTGLDLSHPDFAGRKIISQSFIRNEEVQDLNGHGTHCIGTACGPESPGTLPRYGIAHNAEIFAGKVLSNQGSGSDRGILAGIEWAIANGCQIISMSLGAPTRPGTPYSRIYERVGQRALDRGSLIIAAAGNSSAPYGSRLPIPNPVGHPANCPSIMAVAAVNNQLQIAPFSDASINRDGGQIDIAGPGVDVYSTWPMPTRYRSISGTSMATPHVSGIAALYVQATQATGRNLWGLMMQDALRLSLSSIDAGVGLVQTPL